MRVGAGGGVEVDRDVLGALEGLEAVDGDGLGRGVLGAQALVEEQAVAAQALGLAQDGGGRDGEVAGDLAVGGAGDEASEEAAREVGAFEPVGGGEGL